VPEKRHQSRRAVGGQLGPVVATYELRRLSLLGDDVIERGDPAIGVDAAFDQPAELLS
jgi:hypothetical protein